VPESEFALVVFKYYSIGLNLPFEYIIQIEHFFSSVLLTIDKEIQFSREMV
jgi:hypothetical protein